MNVYIYIYIYLFIYLFKLRLHVELSTTIFNISFVLFVICYYVKVFIVNSTVYSHTMTNYASTIVEAIIRSI